MLHILLILNKMLQNSIKKKTSKLRFYQIFDELLLILTGGRIFVPYLRVLVFLGTWLGRNLIIMTENNQIVSKNLRRSELRVQHNQQRENHLL